MDAARSVSRASVSSNTFSCEPGPPGIDLPRFPERTQGLDERLIRQLRADEIDRATEQDVESRVAGTTPELGREPGLPDAGFSSDEHGRTTPGSCRIKRALEFPELTRPPDEHLAPASHHSRPVSPSPAAAGPAL